MRTTTTWGMAAVCCAVIGCAPGAIAPPAAPAVAGPIPEPLRARFADGLAAMAKHDKADDWTEASCGETLALLGAAGDTLAAGYDAGLVLRRCKKEGEARARFEAVLARDPGFFRARAALALGLAQEKGGLERAIGELERAVRDARFGDAEALVALATLQMRRGSAVADEEGADDLARAQRNLHRALAIDDRSMPALNQLALVHLTRARRAGGPKPTAGKKASVEALEMAALICAQAIRKNGRWAPIHNTAGLVEVELGNLSRAAAEFDDARRLDPALLEAQMNLAALNLAVRGFARAEEAYRAVLARAPDDYDARLGLALALRAQIDDATGPARAAEAAREIAAAKRIAPERPEAYFNEAILVQEYGPRYGELGEASASLARAKGLFEQFLAKADGLPAYAEARGRAEERLRDIAQISALGAAPPPLEELPEKKIARAKAQRRKDAKRQRNRLCVFASLRLCVEFWTALESGASGRPEDLVGVLRRRRGGDPRGAEGPEALEGAAQLGRDRLDGAQVAALAQLVLELAADESHADVRPVGGRERAALRAAEGAAGVVHPGGRRDDPFGRGPGEGERGDLVVREDQLRARPAAVPAAPPAVGQRVAPGAAPARVHAREGRGQRLAEAPQLDGGGALVGGLVRAATASAARRRRTEATSSARERGWRSRSTRCWAARSTPHPTLPTPRPGAGEAGQSS